MIITMWILFIASILVMLSYFNAVGQVEKHNKAATMFGQMHIKTEAKIRFWVAFVLFAVTAGVIFGGLWR